MCLQVGSSSQCTHNLLHILPAYFKALVQFCFSVFCCRLLQLLPIFCLIVIHVQSVCLANLPRVQTISTELLHVHVSLSLFCAAFCIICLTLMIQSSRLVKKSCRNAAGLLYKLKAFKAPWDVRVHKRLRLEQ